MFAGDSGWFFRWFLKLDTMNILIKAFRNKIDLTRTFSDTKRDIEKEANAIAEEFHKKYQDLKSKRMNP